MLATYIFATWVAMAMGQQCYFPNGDRTPGDVPCSSDEHTPCCGPDAICLTNGLCLTQPDGGVMSRGSCTDPSWGSNCTQLCAGNDDDPTGGAIVSILGWAINATTLWCCGLPTAISNTTVGCPNNADAFVLPEFQLILGRALLANVTYTSSTSMSSASSTSTSTASCPSRSAVTSSSNETAVGAGVGIPLGLIALASLGWAFYERRKRKMGYRSTSRDVPLDQKHQPFNQYGQGPTYGLGRTEMPVDGSHTRAEMGPPSHRAVEIEG